MTASEPPRVLRDVTLLWLSLDLEPGPYGAIPEAVPEAVPEAAGEDEKGQP